MTIPHASFHGMDAPFPSYNQVVLYRWRVTALSSEASAEWFVCAATRLCAESIVRGRMTEFERRLYCDGINAERMP